MGMQPLAAMTEQPVRITLGEATLDGDLALPAAAQGLVIFAHGSGSSRHSPRNRFVARSLNRLALGTLLMDLLTEEEEAEDRFSGHLRFDIDLLATRLVGAVDWARQQVALQHLSLGLFGASTGAAAALVAAAKRPEVVDAVVSRGGRPDLAGGALRKVQAATLLIVGGADHVVIELNQQAQRQLIAARAVELIIVPGAGHLFEEPGALEAVAGHAGEWFRTHLKASASVPH
jgi:putative phosphoribosyl transferase